MSNIQRRPTPIPAPPQRQPSRQLQRMLDRIDGEAVAKMAKLRNEAIIAREMMHQLDHVTNAAVAGHALTVNFAAAASQGNPMTAAENEAFVATGRIIKMDALINLGERFHRIAEDI